MPAPPRFHLLILSLATCGLIACSDSNPRYCGANDPCPDDLVCDTAGDYGLPNRCVERPADEVGCDACSGDRPYCSPEGECVACRDDGDCPDEAPHCGANMECTTCTEASDGDAVCAGRDESVPLCTPDGQCAQCLNNSDCSAALPTCSDAGACVGCVLDSDCDSKICAPSGQTCIEEDKIIFVADNGDDASNCGLSKPCVSLSRAQEVANINRNWIHLDSGEYDEIVSVSGGTALNIVGLGSPTITGYVILDGGGTLYLRGLSLVGSGTNATGEAGIECATTADLSSFRMEDGEISSYSSGHGILSDGCAIDLVDVRVADNGVVGIAGGLDTDLELKRSTVTENGSWGINTEGAEVVLIETEISENGSGGVLNDGGRLEVRRSRIIGNSGRGLLIYAADFVMTNSWIVENGGTSSVGGLEFQTELGAEQVLEFNTFVNNTEGSATIEIQCDADAGTVLGSSIVISDQTAHQNCTFAHSLGSSVLPGTANLTGTTSIFQSAGTSNYHLTASNDAIDAAAPGATIDVDIDGDARPEGSGRDIGADEYVP